MDQPRIYADFHNADSQGRLRLNCIGTARDLSHHQVSLADGVALTFYSEELEVDGTVRYSKEEGGWVAEIDWEAIRRLEPAGEGSRDVHA